jgi:hypothetical protein
MLEMVSEFDERDSLKHPGFVSDHMRSRGDCIQVTSEKVEV